MSRSLISVYLWGNSTICSKFAIVESEKFDFNKVSYGFRVGYYEIRRVR